MRVISGTARGLKLVAPTGNRTRPALDQVKEAIFNILFDVSDMRVLDLFAGSGSIGIEALSRGASEAVFVDEWNKATEVIRKNLEHCHLDDRAMVIRSQVDRAVDRFGRKGEKFDLIFVDPPYQKDLVTPSLTKLSAASIASENAIIVVEHHPKETIGEIDGLRLTDSRKYGQTLITFLEPTGSG
jgi:16S rRNA (guanine966-N2)-methyltransferase